MEIAECASKSSPTLATELPSRSTITTNSPVSSDIASLWGEESAWKISLNVQNLLVATWVKIDIAKLNKPNALELIRSWVSLVSLKISGFSMKFENLFSVRLLDRFRSTQPTCLSRTHVTLEKRVNKNPKTRHLPPPRHHAQVGFSTSEIDR